MSIPGEKITVYSVPSRPARVNGQIGALLVDSGKITKEEADRVMSLQREKGMRFGDAAIKLGLVTPLDIEQALSRQFDFPYLVPGTSSLSGDLITAYSPFDKKVEVFKVVRSQLMLRWFNIDLGSKHLAVVSACRKEGRSYFAANLAIVFSQLGERTLLIDADLRNPCQHTLFNLQNRTGLSTLLSGRGQPDVVEHIVPLVDLSILPAGPGPPNPQELLGRSLFSKLLSDLAGEYDVIILDTPSGEANADAQIIAACAGGAFVVARRNHSPARLVRDFSAQLRDNGVTLTGAVMNVA